MDITTTLTIVIGAFFFVVGFIAGFVVKIIADGDLNVDLSGIDDDF